MDAHLFVFFTFRNAKHFEITSQPPPASPPHPTRFLPISRTELSWELWPPDLTIPENGEDALAPKLDEDQMPPKMRKWWMHHGIEAMKEAVAGNWEVALELEAHPGMWDMGFAWRRVRIG